MTGRPTNYSDELADAICEHLASGRSLLSFCRENDIGYSTVTQWLRTNNKFAAKYTLARESQADFHADEIIEIADDPTIQPEQKRVQIDARKWKAGKMKPKVYGDRVQQDITVTNVPLPEQDRAILDSYVGKTD